MIKVIPVINNKGGVGKTTTTVNLSAGLARAGRRVLLVDIDGQASASLALGVPREELRPSSADVVYGRIEISKAIRPTALEGLDLLTGYMDLADFDLRTAKLPQREYQIRDMLQPVYDAYDHIILDCAPSTSLLSINAILAADAIIIPLQPSYLGIEGMMSLGEAVRRIRAALGQVAPVLGILLTMVNYDEEGTDAVVKEIRSYYGAKVFDTEIYPDVALVDAPGFGQTIYEFAPQSQAARQYGELAQEVMDRIDRIINTETAEAHATA
jgi:chromosome partitioning protein